MNMMKKTRQYGSIRNVIVVLALALGIGCGIFGLMSAARMLSVSAEPSGDNSPRGLTVSPAEIGGSVSPADSSVRRRVVSDGVNELVPLADPEPLAVPLYVTHDITLNDGVTVVTTAYPPGLYSNITGVASSVISGETKLEVSFDRSVPSSQPGLFYCGHDLAVSLRGLTANYSRTWSYWFNGAVKVSFTDGSSINWPLGTAWGDNGRYDGTFKWEQIADQIGERTVASVTLNQINAFPIPFSISVVRHSDARIQIESYNSGNAWDLFYPRQLEQYGNTGLTVPDNVKSGVATKSFDEDDTASTYFSTYMMKSGKIKVSSLSGSVSITGVRLYNTNGTDISDGNVTFSDGQYVVNLPYGAIVDVLASDMSPHKVTAQVTSPDLTLHTVAVADSYSFDSFHSSVNNQRFSDQACTNALTNGTKYPRVASNGCTSEDGKTVSFTCYHRNQSVNYYMSLVCYDRQPDAYISDNSTANPQATEIYDLHFIKDSTGEDVTSSIEYRIDYKSGSPYVQFKPPAYDVTVQLKQKLKDDYHYIKIHEKRPTKTDTVWVSKLVSYNNSKKDSPIYFPGKSVENRKHTCGNNNNAYFFPSDELEHTWDMGYYRKDSVYNYELQNYSGNWDNSTMVKSWKIYDDDTGEEVDIGLSYAGSSDSDYYANVGSTYNAAVFESTSFTMPNRNLRIEIEYGKTIGACVIKQQIVTSTGAASPAGDGFSVRFTGTARDADTSAYIFGTATDNQTPSDTFTADGANNGFGLYKGTTNVKLTPMPASGYAVSYIRVSPAVTMSNDFGSQLVRDGDTFSIPNSIIQKTTNSDGYGGNGLVYEITISYAKVATVRLEQRADGVPAPSSSTLVGTVTLSSQNDGSFVDPNSTATNNLVKTYQNKLLEGSEIDGKIAKSSVVYASAGNKLTVNVKVNASGSRVLSGVTVRRTNSDTPLDMTLSTSKYDTVEYKLNETLAENDDITIEVEYMTANHIKFAVLEKNPDTESTMMTNTTSAYAEIVGTGAATAGRGYQFIKSSDRSQTCDSFTVQNTVEDYLTTGQTKLSIQIKDLPEGYVIANVETSFIKSNGDPGDHAEGLMPSSQNLDGYGLCYDYSQCTINTAERNLYIRVYLARLAEVTVRFRSRSDFDEAEFEDNTVSNTYATFEHTNACYGSGDVYPVIVENDSGSKYNTSAYTVTNNPSVRHVYAIDRVKMTGTISMPKNYTIASVVAARTRDGETEAITAKLSNYNYKVENGVEVYQAKFALPDQLENGYDYEVTVYIEKVTTVSLKIYHSSETGEFVPNTLTDSRAFLKGVRRDESGLYSGAVYQSSVPFHHMTQSTSAPTGQLEVVKSSPAKRYYVLRHTVYQLYVKPASDDEIYDVRAFEEDGDTYDCTYRETDESGYLVYDVTQNGSPKKSEMNHEIIFEVYFADKRTEGTVIVENRDYISGELIDNPGQMSLVLSNVLYSKPAQLLPDGDAVGGSVSITGSSAAFSVITGTKTKLSTRSWADYQLYSYTVQYDDGEISTNYTSPSSFGYELNLNVTADGQVKVVNYYVRAAYVYGKAVYGENDWEVTQLRPDIRYKSQFQSVFVTCTAKKGDEVIAEGSMSTGYEESKYLITGDSAPFTLSVRELSGYTLSELILGCEGYDMWTLKRDQITSDPAPESGSNYIEVDFDSITQGTLSDSAFANLKEAFSSLRGGVSYSVEAVFTADIIHVTAYEMSYDDFLILEDIGLQAYQQQHGNLGYHSAKRVAHVSDYSIDGSQNDIYYKDSYTGGYEQYDIGVRRSSDPECTVNYQYHVTRGSSSDYYEYYRVGAIYYGQSMSTQHKIRLGLEAPLPVGFGHSFRTGPVYGESYLTVIYVLFTDEDIKIPVVKEETYSSKDTVVKNTRLTVNLYCYDEESDGYVAITDAAMLQQIAATVRVKQTCVGYYPESSDEKNKYSNAQHHANYVPPEGSTEPFDEAIVYHHDNLPMLYRYDWEQSSFISQIDALIADEMDGVLHPEGITTKEASVSVTAANTLYAVKYNSIDKVHVYLSAAVPPTYNLQKMEINSNGTVTTKTDSGNYDYQTADGGDVTVSYYFSRPILEISTNNVTDEAKGTVMLHDETVIKDTDYMQAMSFYPGDSIRLVIIPNDGYEFDYIRAGSSRSNDMAYVPSDKISQTVIDGKAATIVDLGTPSQNVYVHVQFRNESMEDLALLTVSQFKIDSSGNAIPIKNGKVVITGTGSSDEVLRSGETKGNKLTLNGAEYIFAEVLAETQIDFDLTPPQGYAFAADPFRASYQNKGESDSNQINPGHVDNSVRYTISSDIVQKDRAITVNVYFAPQYRLIYDANGGSGTPPTDNTYYPSGTTVTEFAGRGSLTRTGFHFGGWSLSKTEAEEVTSVTFADENITLYAIWLPKSTYTVTYHSTGHSGDVPQDGNNPYYDGDTVYLLDKGEMTKEVNGIPYTFVGWDTDASADEVIYVPYDADDPAPPENSHFVITNDTDLYAVWEVPEFTVTYDANGGDGKAPEDSNSPYAGGSVVTVLDKDHLTKTGYDFKGWSRTPGDNNSVDYTKDSTFTIAEDTVLYAVWEINTYHVRYVLTVPDDVNYTFSDDDEYAYKSNVTLQAKPTPADYADPNKYTFNGWNNSDDDLNWNEAGTAFVMPAHDVVFTGVFDTNGKASLVYNANGGQPADKVPPSESVYGSLSSTVKGMPSACTRTGYNFSHWNTEQDGSGDSYSKGDSIQVPENSTTVLYAQWSVGSYNVEYYDIDGYSQGKEPIKKDAYPYAESVSVGAAAPDVAGKKFSRWVLVDDSQTDANGEAIGERNGYPMPADTVRYKAVYDDLQYRVVYLYTGTEPENAPALPTDDRLYAFGEDVEVKAAPAAPDGYRFNGWLLGGGKTAGFTIGAGTPADPVAGNDLLYTITLTGVWSKDNEVSIIYTSGLSGDEITDQSLGNIRYDACVKGEDYTVRGNEGYTDYVRPGYEFAGWRISRSGSESNPFGWVMPLLRAAIPVFFGDSDVYQGGDVIPALSENITLSAVWQENAQPTYTVTYHGNENTSGNPPTDSAQYTAGSSATVKGPNTLQKTGYDFDGWTTEPAGGDHYAPGDTVTVNADIHLYARWKPVADKPDDEPDKPDEPEDTYRVYYDGNGATGGNLPEDLIEYKPESAVKVLSQGNLSKTGYTFAGWNTQSDGKGTTYQPGDSFTIGRENVTLYAMWHPVTTDSPGTGEGMWLIATAVLAMILSAAAVAVILRRKRPA